MLGDHRCGVFDHMNDTEYRKVIGRNIMGIEKYKQTNVDSIGEDDK